MYALILIVFIQGTQSLDPVTTRIDISPEPIASEAACWALLADMPGEEAAAGFDGERRQYVSRSYECVQLKGM